MSENQSKNQPQGLLDRIASLVPRKTKNQFIHLPFSVLANIFYGFPSKKLKIIGVTGTDGKTTTVSLIYHILVSAGFKAGMISTVSAKIEGEEIDTGFHITAPDPWLLQKLLLKMAKKGLHYAVLETTSHGLDQFRLWGVDFDVGVLTNITHEHLDYHKSLKDYQLAKLELFLHSKIAVLNKDDPSFKLLFSKIRKDKRKKVVTYAIKNRADFTPKKFPFKTNLPGEYNRYNCLAAITAASVLQVKPEIIKQALITFPAVKGRLEEIDGGQNFKIYVDFAHTPNALKQVLSLLRKQKSAGSRLIAVFGAAGLRDTEKRPMMGEIAGKLADFSVITAEDPRTEDVNQICRQIAEGCQKAEGNFKVIVDRQKAFDYAICKLAKKNDIVVVCGKGHERSMCFGQTEYPWSEHAAVRKSLQLIKKEV